MTEFEMKMVSDGKETFKYYTDFFTGVSEDNVAKEIKDWLIRTDVELVGVLMYEENPPACTMTWQCYKVYYKHKELR